MKNLKLLKQIGTILSLILCFVVFDVTVYEAVTKRYINHTSEGMQAKSVELDKYLPFDENSEIVKINSDLKLSGELPVIDGAAALYPVFSGFVNAVYPAESVHFDGENFTADSALQYTNTRGAYKSVVDGTADIIFCAKPSAEQLAYADENQVELELVPIGSEAFVFLVNADNPVDLTLEQVIGIYAGEYTKWSEVGGDDTFIEPLQRNEGSGSQTAMLSLMNGREMKKNPFGFVGRSIGFSFRYYVEGIVGNGGVKMLSLNGAYPDKENIQNGSYPIVSNFYAVYDKNNPNPNIEIFLDWILSDEGQEIVEKSGYVSVKSS